MNRSNLERAALGKRVGANEEWVASINNFRKQVNTNVNQLRADIRAISAQIDAIDTSPTPAPAPAEPAAAIVQFIDAVESKAQKLDF